MLFAAIKCVPKILQLSTSTVCLCVCESECECVCVHGKVIETLQWIKMNMNELSGATFCIYSLISFNIFCWRILQQQRKKWSKNTRKYERKKETNTRSHTKLKLKRVSRLSETAKTTRARGRDNKRRRWNE